MTSLLLIYISHKCALKGFVIGSSHRERFAALQRKLRSTDLTHLIQIHKIAVMTAGKLPRRKLFFKIRKRKIIGAVTCTLVDYYAVIIALDISYVRKR